MDDMTEITAPEDTVTISDIGTGIGRTITADQLRQISRIITTKE
jgi:hypothetical protein